MLNRMATQVLAKPFCLADLRSIVRHIGIRDRTKQRIAGKGTDQMLFPWAWALAGAARAAYNQPPGSRRNAERWSLQLVQMITVWTFRVHILSLRSGVGCSFFHHFHILPPQQQLVVHTLITHCNCTLHPIPSTNKIIDSPQTNESAKQHQYHTNHSHVSPPIKQRRITSISQQQLSTNQWVRCDHQFHGSLQRAREPYPPAQLTSPAGSTGFARRRFAPAPAPTVAHTAHLHVT
jgi:hypothetical protein